MRPIDYVIFALLALALWRIDSLENRIDEIEQNVDDLEGDEETFEE